MFIYQTNHIYKLDCTNLKFMQIQKTIALRTPKKHPSNSNHFKISKLLINYDSKYNMQMIFKFNK